MKKGFIFIESAIILFIFFGCSNPSSNTGGGNITHLDFSVTIPENSNKDVFLIKYNPSYNFVPYNKTGYVENNQRAATDSSDSSNSSDFSSSSYIKTSYDKRINPNIDRLNSEITKTHPLLPKTSANSRNILASETQTTEQTYTEDTKRDFYYFSSENAVTLAEFTCKYVGKHCYVWFYDSNNKLTPESSFKEEKSFKTLAEKFDSICETEQKYFGKHNQDTCYSNIIKGKEKIDIIVTDLEGDAKEGQNSGKFGYFYRVDTFTDINTSNKTLAIYLDSYFYLKFPEECYSTLVHEYNHLLNWINKMLIHEVNNDKQMETWFTEMLSMVAEDMFQDILGIEDINSPKSRLYQHLNGSYIGFKNWADDDSVYYNYANAYAFGAFLARNYGGAELIKKIATSEYINEEAIEKATNKSFEELMRNFAISFLYPSNGEQPYSANSGIFSLHKGDDQANADGIKFSPIDVTKLFENGKPKIFYAQKYISEDKPENTDLQLQNYYTVSLDGGGFSIHYIGKNVTNFRLNVIDMSSDVKYFTYVQ